MAGYADTSLATKLGIKPGMLLHAVNAPRSYPKLVAPLPAGARIVARKPPRPDIVHLFACRKAELAAALAAYRRVLDVATPVWVSWPKKAAKLPTDITEDTIREVALLLGYVDIKVCAVSEVWSGLKLVVRKGLR